MDDESQRLAEIDRLFSQALDLGGVERALLLSEVRQRDGALAEAVEELLGLAEEDDERLSPTRILTGPLWRQMEGERLPSLAQLQPGERVGAYRVVEELGRGGMAVVYLAERADGGFEQQVALKLLRPGTEGAAEILRRFEQERQILATLNHPAIARLLDGGLDEKGRPFIVLEQVEGQPIDRYCDQHRLSLDQRLGLFLDVARAVQYAHRKLVVHRDLKPSNILVTAEGAVKLLDFGIAKLLDAGAAGLAAGPQTRTLERVLTPEYASPEQVRGEVVSTASDVYQLGLLLYELLTGERAQRLDGGSALEAERIICQQEARRPSTLSFSVTALAARRLTTTQLARSLRGDLDTILLAALRKEAERRYASPTGLIDDLERFRAGLPVSARPDTLGYRTGKFLRRHRLGVAAAALIALLLVGYGATATFQARQIGHERDRAQAETLKAQAVKDFLVSIFEGSEPEQALGVEVSARELLDKGSERVRQELTGQPEVQAELLGTVGEIYRKLGNFERSEELLRQSLAVGRSLPGAELGVAKNLLLLSRVLREKSGDTEAVEISRQALALYEQRLPPGDLRIAWAQEDLALALRARGQTDEAEGWLLKALENYRAQLGSETEEVASTLNMLGILQRTKGNNDEAEALYREALALRRQILPPDHPNLAANLSDLAMLLRLEGNYEPALRIFQEVEGIQKRVLGPKHPRLAFTLNHIGVTQDALGYYQDAEASLREALAIRHEALDPNHRMVGHTLNDLGRVLQNQGKLDEAVDAYRQALTIFGPDNPWHPIAEFNMAFALEEKGELATAERLYRKVLAEQRAAQGEDHPAVAVDLLFLGRLLHNKGASPEAEPLLRQSLERFRALYDGAHPRTAEAALALGVLLRDTGRSQEGCPLLEEAVAMRTEKLPVDDPRTLAAREELARCRRALPAS